MADPHLTSISPDSGPDSGGTQVTLTGSRLQHVDQVTFAGAAATDVRVQSSVTVTCLTPSGSTGTAKVVVHADGTPSNEIDFHYTEAFGVAPQGGLSRYTMETGV
ncbi:IPT/TIG domain-containing protein [Streptomyces sp. O3]